MEVKRRWNSKNWIDRIISIEFLKIIMKIWLSIVVIWFVFMLQRLSMELNNFDCFFVNGLAQIIVRVVSQFVCVFVTDCETVWGYLILLRWTIWVQKIPWINDSVTDLFTVFLSIIWSVTVSHLNKILIE